MNQNQGKGYIGSPDLMVSTAGMEVIPAKPEWTNGYVLYKFSFLVVEGNAKVSINNSAPIFIATNQVYEITEKDAPITSFKVLNDGVKFQWAGAY